MHSNAASSSSSSNVRRYHLFFVLIYFCVLPCVFSEQYWLAAYIHRHRIVFRNSCRTAAEVRLFVASDAWVAGAAARIHIIMRSASARACLESVVRIVRILSDRCTTTSSRVRSRTVLPASITSICCGCWSDIPKNWAPSLSTPYGHNRSFCQKD